MINTKEISRQTVDPYKDSRWQTQRLKMFHRDSKKCQKCGKESNSDNPVSLEIHHLNYGLHESPWDIPDWSLVTLCSDCHQTEYRTAAQLDLLKKQLGDIIGRYLLPSDIETIIRRFQLLPQVYPAQLTRNIVKLFFDTALPIPFVFDTNTVSEIPKLCPRCKATNTINQNDRRPAKFQCSLCGWTIYLSQDNIPQPVKPISSVSYTKSPLISQTREINANPPTTQIPNGIICRRCNRHNSFIWVGGKNPSRFECRECGMAVYRIDWIQPQERIELVRHYHEQGGKMFQSFKEK